MVDKDENDRFMKISAGTRIIKEKGGEGKAYGYYSKLRDVNAIIFHSHHMLIMMLN